MEPVDGDSFTDVDVKLKAPIYFPIAIFIPSPGNIKSSVFSALLNRYYR